MLEQIRAVSLSPVKHLPLLLFTSHSSLLSACTRLRARRAVGAQLLRRHPCLAPSLLFSFSAAVTMRNCTGLQLSTISEKYTYAPPPSLLQGGTESHSWVALTWRRLAGCSTLNILPAFVSSFSSIVARIGLCQLLWRESIQPRRSKLTQRGNWTRLSVTDVFHASFLKVFKKCSFQRFELF